jgi:S1-C subfamily serine protease
MSLEPGDVILSINGQAIGNLDDYWNAVKGSPRTMELLVRDSRHPHPQHRFRVELRY